MRNLWISQDAPIAVWVADLSQLWARPERLLDWTIEVLKICEDTGMLSVKEAPLLKYERQLNGDLGDFLRARFQIVGDVDMFFFPTSRLMKFKDSRQYHATTRISYYDQNGRVTEALVEDLGALLRELRPADVDNAPFFFEHWGPMQIKGNRINFRNLGLSEGVFKRGEVKIRFAIHSDIWLPWVFGFLEEETDVERKYDNRELCTIHTPRFNAFLNRVAALTQQYGGTWTMDREDTNMSLEYMITESGIIIDADCPYGAMECRE